MVWNTIVHPKMMEDGWNNVVNPRPTEETDESEVVPVEIKYCNVPKQAVFDFIIVGTDGSTDGYRLVLGDYDQVARKLINGEIVLGLLVLNKLYGRFVQHARHSEDIVLREVNDGEGDENEIIISITFEENVQLLWHADNTIINKDADGGGK